MAKPYKRKSKEEKEKEVNELIEKANAGIENCFTTPENLKELLNYMSKFYNYSLRNASLIQEQFCGALAVGSYSFWKEKGFTVNKGEKGIKILVPNKLSDYFINEKGEEVKLSKATTEEKKLIEQGEIEVRQGKLIFNQGYVFEVSQTNAKSEDLPKIFPNRWIEGEVKDYDLMYKAMENIAKKIGVKIIEPKDELGAVKGVSYPATKEVALNPRNTQLQNVKTLIHELTHAKLHTMETRDNYTTNAKEFQAEMAAYVVCSYFGLDTSEYSFRYINSWTKDVELKDKEKLINEVRETVKEYIEVIEKTLINDKELSLSLENENILEKKIEDEKLINFLGKDKVVIKEITRDELENIINENNSNVYLQKDKELNIKNEVVAIEVKGKYTDVYIGKSYDLNNLIYIDDDKNLYKLKEEKIHDKNLYEIKEQEFMNNNNIKENVDKNSIYEIKEDKKWLNKYFYDKGINQELREELIENKKFLDLANAKVDLESEYNKLDEEIKRYDEEIFPPLEILEKELEVNKYLQSFVNKEINKIVGYELEEDNYIERVFVTSEDIKLKDGSFIEKGTSFFITDIIEDDGIPLYKADFKGIDEIKYFYDRHLAECSNLLKVKEEVNEVEQGRENDDWKLTDKEIAEAERLIELEEMKEKIEKLMKENYGDFVKAMISIEKGIDDLDLLDKVYEEYMERDFNLLNNEIDKSINFEKENIVNAELENKGDRSVEVIYSEVSSFVEGEKLTLVETLEKFKKEVENGTVDKAIEFTFSLNENIKYNEEFIIDKGTSVDLIEVINEKIGDNFYLHKLVDDYLKSNDLEFEHKEIILDKDKKIEKYKEMELE
ncbi:ImmA/IrrE family metallo-endopeptidase [Clostridium cuniculi]|uniref:ImmA/IrrE family metallo-endopeptidase n=1 Tax=Clostridium cuniculi TaxID=2548455 RepID=UPI001056786A|nr:ImmA/IrrE family metallo-endopeptidase [Clostridium cuniculi]